MIRHTVHIILIGHAVHAIRAVDDVHVDYVAVIACLFHIVHTVHITMRRVGMFTVYRKKLASLYSETEYPRGNKRQMLMHLSCAAPASGNLLRQRLWQVFSKIFWI